MGSPRLNTAERLKHCRRIVVKVGSSLLVNQAYQPRHDWMRAFAEDVIHVFPSDTDVIIVSSGAAAMGRAAMFRHHPELLHQPMTLEQKQAAAAVGQIHMMVAWREAFAAHGRDVGQMLLTLRESENRRSYLNARSTLDELLGAGIIPVINENDSLATRAIRVGDNDRLAARAAQMAGADALVLFSDVDGLYTANPRQDPAARLIPEIRELTPAIMALAGGSGSLVGTGGMQTKLEAAQIALASGCDMAIVDGRPLHTLAQWHAGANCSWFISSQPQRSARQHWILGSLRKDCWVVLDAGAEQALRQGKSLLPVGIREVHGQFQRGDAVTLMNLVGQRLGCGLSSYSSHEAERIIGKNNHDIATILGYQGRNAFIHRNDLVLD